MSDHGQAGGGGIATSDHGQVGGRGRGTFLCLTMARWRGGEHCYV